MSSVVKFNNKVLRLNNKTVGWTAPPVLYYVTTNGVNGTVVATPNTGYNGDTITLSNTPNEGYEFDSYSLTGATLYDTNKFDINNSDVNVLGNFTLAPPSFDEVQIGTQTWMSKNLAINDGGSGISVIDDVTNSNGYNFGTQTYYNFSAAKRVADSIDGWRLPSYNDLYILSSFIISDKGSLGNQLKSTTGWVTASQGRYGNGSDAYGFSGAPVGSISPADISNNTITYIGQGVDYWSNDISSNNTAACYLELGIWNNSPSFSRTYSRAIDMNARFCVRLVKEKPTVTPTSYDLTNKVLSFDASSFDFDLTYNPINAPQSYSHIVISGFDNNGTLKNSQTTNKTLTLQNLFNKIAFTGYKTIKVGLTDSKYSKLDIPNNIYFNKA